MKIEREHTAAIVIDYQEKLVPAMSGKEGLIENSSILLAGLCTLDVPVFLTQQYTRGLGTTVKEIREAARTEEFVEKIRFSAYEDVLKECPSIQEKKYIILCGIEAHICVLQTLIDLRAHGYIPVLVTDCISSRKDTDKEIAILRAQEEGAVLTTYEALLFELLGAAGTEESKKIQRLVK